ncbi:hypothetical protein V1511DRAFT_507005 [Dipodascopsis uninucleata]
MNYNIQGIWARRSSALATSLYYRRFSVTSVCRIQKKKDDTERLQFDHELEWKYTKSPQEDWQVGSGANDDNWKNHSKIEIDPYEEGRNPLNNYKLLVSGIIPRPIGFLSTTSSDGLHNLAPFSYFTVVNHDPPIFCLGFAGGMGKYKDSARNLLETKECTINIISEWFAEAANYASVDTPSEISEWTLTGLTKVPSKKVRSPHVAESAFSIEGRLVETREWTSRVSNKPTGLLCVIEGVNFHIREDVLSDDFTVIKPELLKPVGRLGGSEYLRTTTSFELGRLAWKREKNKPEVQKIINQNHE